MKKNNPRIIAGEFKNLQLEVPINARPITDRVKRMIFDHLQNQIEGESVLDLFAGSGSIGIEAMSRGANFVLFVDGSKEAFEVLKNNLKKINSPKHTHKIILSDYQDFIKSYTGNFKFIFIDPPFNIQKNLRLKGLEQLVSADGILIYKIENKVKDQIKPIEGFSVILEKKMGINTVIFMQRNN